MPTRKIADLTPTFVCRHPEHDPPSMMVYEDGVYEHECPRCGHKQRFVVSKPTLGLLRPRRDWDDLQAAEHTVRRSCFLSRR